MTAWFRLTWIILHRSRLRAFKMYVTVIQMKGGKIQLKDKINFKYLLLFLKLSCDALSAEFYFCSSFLLENPRDFYKHKGLKCVCYALYSTAISLDFYEIQQLLHSAVFLEKCFAKELFVMQAVIYMSYRR